MQSLLLVGLCACGAGVSTPSVPVLDEAPEAEGSAEETALEVDLPIDLPFELPFVSSDEPGICTVHCDRRDPALAHRDARVVATASLGGATLAVRRDDSVAMAWASIENASPGDTVWLDRSWDGGETWADGSRLGATKVPRNGGSWRTMMYNINDLETHRRGAVRACGQAKKGGQLACTEWVNRTVCNSHCDGRDAALAKGDRAPVGSRSVRNRVVTLHVDDASNMGWASIRDGGPGDEVWLDRSWDDGASWPGGGLLGKTRTPEGARATRTAMFNLDDPYGLVVGGLLRACGKAAESTDVVCTEWARAAPSRAWAGAAALAHHFSPKEGSFGGRDSWWHSANGVTALLDYDLRFGTRHFLWVASRTFDAARSKHFGNFKNWYLDDTGWWGLAWIRAYDLTRDGKYLDMARETAEHMANYWDGTCNGGVWWTMGKSYKNAITTELYFKLAASLHNRMPGDTVWLERAKSSWSWIRDSGLINGDNLINDGLNDQCRNNGDVAWTYNQGVVLGGLVELARATGDGSLLDFARKLADASSTRLVRDGVLAEFCDPDCGADGPLFKGVYARNLGELSRVSGGRYDGFLARQSDALWNRNRNARNQFGGAWSGPIDRVDFSRQVSAVDALIAAGF